MKNLLLDIETAPHKVYAWGLWGQDIRTENIIEPGYTLCWSAKWRGDRSIMFSSIYQTSRKKMVKEVYRLMCEADAITHYNGTKFDIPTLNQEFLYDSLDPPSTYVEIDLLKTARKKFRLPSNKLDYVAQYLGLGGKIKHRGMDMWRDCMNGCPKAWRLMKRYNRHDVVLLEKVYDALLPWIDYHPNWGHYVEGEKMVCSKCGSDKIKKNGLEKKTVLPYQRYKCLNCGSNLRSRLSLRDEPRPKIV